eukprot:TRINITY_DN4481_c0_g2_i4.p2 TRINITY_DN4481_c0_g2~~TRINITY_DN4481_c0_g2_i4.p2  ORF type:complete len:114 (-),score=20.07 TRINITY_DN4481_c0_g2_i4:11-352(-)
MMDRRKTFQLAANNLLLDTKKLNTKPEGIVVGSPLKGKLIKKRVISHYDSSKFSPLIGSPTLAVKGSAYRQMDASPSARFFPTYEPDMVPCTCLLYTSPSPRDGLLSRMPSSA